MIISCSGGLIDFGLLFLISFRQALDRCPGASCTDIGSGYGWEIDRNRAMEIPGVSTLLVDVGSQLDLGLTDITKYSSYSKLWRMLYFINDAPFCIHMHPKPSGSSTQDRDSIIRTLTSSFYK